MKLKGKVFVKVNSRGGFDFRCIISALSLVSFASNVEDRGASTALIRYALRLAAGALLNIGEKGKRECLAGEECLRSDRWAIVWPTYAAVYISILRAVGTW